VLQLVWEYAVLFGMAAVPFVEILVVIPLGIAYGLSPIPVALVAFAGNILPVWLIIAAYRRWESWRAAGSAEPKADPLASRRGERARRLRMRYGLPGLALLAPLLTGVHLAAVMALALGSPRRATAAWMAGAVAVWAIAITAAVHFGIEGARWITG
jgi:Ca2+/H+ antiporter, TMEM165/GDT1 family